MINETHTRGTQRRRCRHMRAIVSACLASVFALMVCASFFGQHLLPQPSDPAPVEDTAITDDSALEETKGSDASGGGNDEGYVPSEVLVAVDPHANVENVNAVLAMYDFALTKDVSDQDLSAGYAKIALAEGASVKESVATLILSGLTAQPNYIYTVAEDSDEDLLALTEAASGSDDADNAGTAEAPAPVSINDTRRNEQWALDSVNAYRAWGIEKCEDKGDGRVSIAVIDTGVDFDHEDLQPNLKATYLTPVKNDKDAPDREESTEPSDVDDKNGHGTHVSGIAAGVTNNDKGIAGISYNAGLVAIKASTTKDGKSFNTASLADAYAWLFKKSPGSSQTNAELHNVRVINLSVGGNKAVVGVEGYDKIFLTKISQAYTGAYADNGSHQSILTVAAAGNSMEAGDLPYIVYPGEYKDCLSVINIGKSDGWSTSNNVVTRSNSSNFNVDDTHVKNISAPGTDILSTVKEGDYASDNGTSMAAPCVSGIAALLFSENSDLNAEQAKDILLKTATDIPAKADEGPDGWDRQTGYGEVDAYHALQIASASLGENATISCFATETFAIRYGDGTGWETFGSADDWKWSVPKPEDEPSVIEVKTIDDGQAIEVTAMNPGVATIFATLKNADGDSDTSIVLEKTITVKGCDISEATIEVPQDHVYTGKPITPTPTKVTLGDMTLAPENYTVSYENNMNAGTATLKVTGRGSFTGTVQTTFTIEKADISSASLGLLDAYTYQGQAVTPRPKVEHDDMGTLTADVDYRYEYQNNTQVRNDARMRVVGIGNFTGETPWATFKIKSPADPKKSITGATIDPIPAQTYTGGELRPAVTVTLDGKRLVAGTDYDVSYSSNVNVGTAVVTITGKGNYKDSRKALFSIMGAHVQTPATPTPDPPSSGSSGSSESSGQSTPMYRLYNPNSGEHLFTVDANEYSVLPRYGWRQEGVAWNSPSDGTPVYRLYNPYSGDHHYTMDANEYATLPRHGWRQEGVAFRSDPSRGKTIYRLFNPYASTGTHHYTLDANEYATLPRHGWRQEGVAWYGSK